MHINYGRKREIRIQTLYLNSQLSVAKLFPDMESLFCRLGGVTCRILFQGEWSENSSFRVYVREPKNIKIEFP